MHTRAWLKSCSFNPIPVRTAQILIAAGSSIKARYEILINDTIVLGNCPCIPEGPGLNPGISLLLWKLELNTLVLKKVFKIQYIIMWLADSSLKHP